MNYRFVHYHTKEVIGEATAVTLMQASHQICRQKWGVNYDNALAAEFLKRKDLTVVARRVQH